GVPIEMLTVTPNRLKNAGFLLPRTVASLCKNAVSTSSMVGLAAAAVVLASISTVSGTIGLLGAGLGVAMISIAAVDRRHFLIPDWLNAVGFVLALVHGAALEPDATAWAVAMAVIRAGVLGLVFLALRRGYARVRDRQGLGLG